MSKTPEWILEAQNALRKINKAYENGTGTRLTKREVSALMKTSIGEGEIYY